MFFVAEPFDADVQGGRSNNNVATVPLPPARPDVVLLDSILRPIVMTAEGLSLERFLDWRQKHAGGLAGQLRQSTADRCSVDFEPLEPL